MKNLFLKQVLLLSFVISAATTVHALEVTTHQAINEYIANFPLNGFSFGDYLTNQLGFEKGKDTEFKSLAAWKWLRDGGRYEDNPPEWYSISYLRSVNHFHNPLTDQGFSGIWGTGFLYGVSSIQWSQEDIGTQSPYGHYSWKDARSYFYIALTGKDFAGKIVASTKEDRDKYFADTFRGLGQLMHLVEDVSVPEHTRDDGHYLFWNYEKFVNTIIPDANAVSQYTPIYFDSTKIGNTNSLASVPIANLFDTNQYNRGTSPDTTLRNDIGLSEYTNANFLSPDSMFTSDFPYPNLGSVVEFDDDTVKPGKKIPYLRKLGQGETEGSQIGNGDHIEHLALRGWPYRWLPANLKKNALRPVYSDYAQKLLPRAVGYSAQLLGYFFRGQIEAVNPNISATGGTLKVKNNTPNEDMVAPGKFVVSYQYTEAGSNPPVYHYGASDPVALAESIPSGAESTTEYSFTFSSGSIPSDAQDIKYWLVFRGKLGNEDDAVAANMISPWYGYLDGSLTDNRYFWSSKTKTWNLVPLNDLIGYVDGKHLAIGRNGAVVIAEADGSNWAQIKIAASHDYGVTWQTTSFMSPAPQDWNSWPAIDVSDDGVFWLGIGASQGQIHNSQFDVFVYRSENGLSWELKGSATVENHMYIDPEDFDIAATTKNDATTDVYIVWRGGDQGSQSIGKFINGSAYYSPVYRYEPGADIRDNSKIEANNTDWFLWTTKPPFYGGPAIILKNGTVVLDTNIAVDNGLHPWTGDIRYSSGKVVAVGTSGYAPIFALSLDGGTTWRQPMSPAGLGNWDRDWFSVDISGNKIIYSVIYNDYNFITYYKIFEGSLSTEGPITWTLVDSGLPPFTYIYPPTGHIRFGLW